MPTRKRAATPKSAHRCGILVDILSLAEKRAAVQASFRLEFRRFGLAREFNQKLVQLQCDDPHFSNHLLVYKMGRSLDILYNPHTENIQTLPGRELAQRSMSEMVRRGELVRAAEFADSLGVTKQAVSKALRDKRVFTVEVGGAQYYPSFYLDRLLERRQIERVTKALGDLPGPSKLQFFLTPKRSLGGITPLKALVQGKLELVKASAQGFAQR